MLNKSKNSLVTLSSQIKGISNIPLNELTFSFQYTTKAFMHFIFNKSRQLCIIVPNK